MPSVTYPLDTTGLASTNRIVGEAHTLTEINSTTYRVIIPEFAPFYLDNFILKYTDTLGSVLVLNEGVDYNLALPYIGATRSIGKMLYGGITINTMLVDGTITIEYQTLGGDWTADSNFVLTKLAELVYNPRITSWDIVTNKLTLFPPINHSLAMDNVFGHEQLINAITQLSAMIVSGTPASQSLIAHLLDDANPHLTNKDQVELGNVSNLPLATDQEVIARSPVEKYVTLRQVLMLLTP